MNIADTSEYDSIEFLTLVQVKQFFQVKRVDGEGTGGNIENASWIQSI